MLTSRWTRLRPHLIQQAYWRSPHRFNVVPAGRRSGKTELAKRKLVRAVLRGGRFENPRYFAAAPTRDQAKQIYWGDLKAMVPRQMMAGDPAETDLSIRLINGAELRVVGMDKPERIEGQPWDGGVLDEYANMKPGAWGANVRPALSDRLGWCDLIGVPEGRNHYYEAFQAARAMMDAHGAASEWGAFHWLSADILPPGEIAAAKRDLDERTFRQEYCATFEAFGGVVYYAFVRELNASTCEYNASLPVEIGMDFNVNPMTASVWQVVNGIDHQVDEIVLPTSNTDEMCDEIAGRFGRPSFVAGRTEVGHITVFPDPAGAQRRTSAQGRTDIGILRDRGFRVVAMSSHPLVRDRVNTVNARFCSADGLRRAFVHPRCKHTIKALEQLCYREGSNEPDKTTGLDHLPDGIGYRAHALYGHVPAARFNAPRAA